MYNRRSFFVTAALQMLGIVPFILLVAVPTNQALARHAVSQVEVDGDGEVIELLDFCNF